jgi:hypothetical protein
MEFWNFGILEFWNFGILDEWNIGRMEEWKNGRREDWVIDLPGFQGLCAEKPVRSYKVKNEKSIESRGTRQKIRRALTGILTYQVSKACARKNLLGLTN